MNATVGETNAGTCADGHVKPISVGAIVHWQNCCADPTSIEFVDQPMNEFRSQFSMIRCIEQHAAVPFAGETVVRRSEKNICLDSLLGLLATRWVEVNVAEHFACCLDVTSWRVALKLASARGAP